MEPLMGAISSSCPAVFTGTPGAIFAQSVAALVAAHCALVGDNHWPIDRSEELFSEYEEDAEFDFVIVGAGTAGSLLARRINEAFPSDKIILIEAGEDPGVASKIPGLIFQIEKEDWKYKTVPEQGYCLGNVNHSCIWSKGKAMGGSSSINVMLFIRNLKEDFDKWQSMGLPNWGYDEVKKYMDRVENEFKINENYNPTDRTPHQIRLLTDFLKSAWEEIGYEFNEIEKHAAVGTMISRLMIQDGVRINTAEMSLANVNSNVLVTKNTKVQKVLVNKDTMTANGVFVKHASGKMKKVTAKKEVILSAGSIATPQLMMLSGIGPSNHLKVKGVRDVLLDLPVGKNLQDHIILPFYFQVHEELSNEMSLEEKVLAAAQYMISRKGLFSKIGIIDFMTFIDTLNISRYPDIQIHHSYITKNDQGIFVAHLKAVGYSKDVIDAFCKLNSNNDLIGMFVTLLHPHSTGEVILKDANPDSEPDIKPNYFINEADFETLIRGIRQVQRLIDTNTFKTLKVKYTPIDIQFCSEEDFDSDAYWRCYARHLAHTIYHPVGTVKMGDKSDPTAVVDEDLLVKGVNNLRVVDASVMPAIVGGNTMASTLMIAEKAGDLIKLKYGVKDEL